jgi:hypothetical protein
MLAQTAKTERVGKGAAALALAADNTTLRGTALCRCKAEQ